MLLGSLWHSEELLGFPDMYSYMSNPRWSRVREQTKEQGDKN